MMRGVRARSSGVSHAKTPFLILQGQSDTTDPLGQAQEMYRALRQQGVPVELVTYPRENHGPLAIGMLGHPSPEPWHGFDARQRIVKFINARVLANSASINSARNAIRDAEREMRSPRCPILDAVRDGKARMPAHWRILQTS